MIAVNKLDWKENEFMVVDRKKTCDCEDLKKKTVTNLTKQL